MRRATWFCTLLLTTRLTGAEDEDAFIHLLSANQLSLWTGDQNSWSLKVEEIQSHPTSAPKPLVYGSKFNDYVLRFSAQVQKGSVWVLLRNTWFAWHLRGASSRRKRHAVAER